MLHLDRTVGLDLGRVHRERPVVEGRVAQPVAERVGRSAVLEVGIGARFAAVAMPVVDRALTGRPRDRDRDPAGRVLDAEENVGDRHPADRSRLVTPGPRRRARPPPRAPAPAGSRGGPRRPAPRSRRRQSSSVRWAPASSTVERSRVSPTTASLDQSGLVAEDDDRHVGARRASTASAIPSVEGSLTWQPRANTTSVLVGNDGLDGGEHGGSVCVDGVDCGQSRLGRAGRDPPHEAEILARACPILPVSGSLRWRRRP